MCERAHWPLAESHDSMKTASRSPDHLAHLFVLCIGVHLNAQSARRAKLLSPILRQCAGRGHRCAARDRLHHQSYIHFKSVNSRRKLHNRCHVSHLFACDCESGMRQNKVKLKFFRCLFVSFFLFFVFSFFVVFLLLIHGYF